MTGAANHKCRYCKKCLEAQDARFCTECNQWQDNCDRFLSQINLGDIALYGSILVLLYSSFHATVFGKHARMEATALACSGYTASAYLSNSGNAPGVVTAATLQAVQGSVKGAVIDTAFEKTDGSSDNRTVAGDSGHVFRLLLDGSDRPTLLTGVASTDNACIVRATFSVITDSEATLETISARGSCSCADFVKS